jgi:hypothetical protein
MREPSDNRISTTTFRGGFFDLAVDFAAKSDLMVRETVGKVDVDRLGRGRSESGRE